MGKKKVLVALTFLAGVFALIFLWTSRPKPLSGSVEIDPDGNPAAGPLHASIEFIVFEDFQCHACRNYSETVFPQIEEKYIDASLARYVLIPVAFIEGSEILGNAALAVYASSPREFFAFAHQLFTRFAEEEPSSEKVLEIAKEMKGIDLAFLSQAMEKKSFYNQLERNLEMAEKIMEDNFGTPALYINGIRTSTASFHAVEANFNKIAKGGSR